MPVRAPDPEEDRISEAGWLRGGLPLSSGPRASSPAPAGRGAAAGVYHTPEGSPPGGLPGPGAWVLHMPAVGLVVDDRGRMKQSVLGYPWEAASRCSSLIEATSFHSLPRRGGTVATSWCGDGHRLVLMCSSWAVVGFNCELENDSARLFALPGQRLFCRLSRRTRPCAGYTSLFPFT